MEFIIIWENRVVRGGIRLTNTLAILSYILQYQNKYSLIGC